MGPGCHIIKLASLAKKDVVDDGAEVGPKHWKRLTHELSIFQRLQERLDLKIDIQPPFLSVLPWTFRHPEPLVFNIVMMKTHRDAIDNLLFVPCIYSSHAFIKIWLTPKLTRHFRT